MRLWHDLPTSVKDKEFPPFRESFIFATLRGCENKTLAKISEFTVVRAKFQYQVFKILLLLMTSICIIFYLTYYGFVIFSSFLCFKFSKQPRHCFAYQWPDNVKINKYRYAKLIQIYHVIQEL